MVLTEYLARFCAAADKFGFVVADPWIYQSVAFRAETDELGFPMTDPLCCQVIMGAPGLSDLKSVIKAVCVTPEEELAAELGIIYVFRRYANIPLSDLCQRVEALLPSCEHVEQLRVRARLTYCAVLGGMGYAEEARNGFAACVDELRSGDDHLAYALACMGLAEAAIVLGEPTIAEASYESALQTAKRFDLGLLIAFATNNLGVLRKSRGEYEASIQLLSQARALYLSLGMKSLLLSTTRNLAITCFRSGDWRSARRWYQTNTDDQSVREIDWEVSRGHLLLNERKFAPAVELLSNLTVRGGASPRISTLIHEFLGELYLETGKYSQAREHLDKAESIARDVAPLGDVMAEILRRQAQLFVLQKHFDEARATALFCISLSRRIGDRYEYAAALRVLGEAYAAQSRIARAAACFRASVATLKSIHECYELMRSLYAQGKFLAKNGKPDDAEIALLEARQLSKKLELEYYQGLIAVAMMDLLGPQERFDEAQTWSTEATALRDHLEGIDRDRVAAELKRAANDLQKLITRASVKSAETIKTICRVYEDARFPFEDMRADLAYQVAQSIGAESLFVIGKGGSGYRVAITYNISSTESKEIVRRLDRILQSKALLNVGNDPEILKTADGRILLAVPCREDEAIMRLKKSAGRFVACARYDPGHHPGPRQIELFCAGAEALARIIEEEEIRPARAPSAKLEPDGDDRTDEVSRPKHPRGSFSNILTIDSSMIKLIRIAERAAGSVAPILLEGETGVGKELFARAIHGASPRKDGPFVAINAGGMSVHLLESELFGHVRGAFTDAGNDRTGLVDTARGGTLFFDEVGEMGEELQVKLLRLMENGEYRRLGESSMRQADVRVISATNRDLKKETERGRFRNDLYYRMSPLKLTVPPLRLRACDIQLLTRYFLRECAAANGIADRYIEIDVKAMEALELYDWPGNVRELHNEILRVVSLIGRGDIVRFAMLSDNIMEFLKNHKRGENLLDRSVEQYERRLILDALERNDWNKVRTADAMGIPRTTLLAKLKRMNVASKNLAA